MSEIEPSAGEVELLDKLHPEHRTAILGLLRTQQALLNELQDDRRSTPTGDVYHYTDEDGLRGITGNGVMWLSDYTSMSDTSEISYGFNIGIKVLREVYEDGPKTGRLRRFVEGTERVAREGLGRYFDAYILSLTPNGDKVSQWEQYAANASGYGLGFDGPALDRAFVALTRGKGWDASGSFEVLYNESQLRALMKTYVVNALDAVMWLSDRPGLRRASVEAMEQVGKNLILAFIFTALFFKDEGYDTEREYRFLLLALSGKRAPNLKTRRNGVSYFEFEWKRQDASALKQVTIGPAQKEDDGRRIIGQALLEAGLSPQIVMSRVPPIRKRRTS